jgi:DNA-binding NtrC family response regulator
MHEDAKRLLARLQAGDVGEADASEPEPAAPEPAADARTSPDLEGSNRTVMVVESKIEMQDLLRDRLKKHGYRVLVFSEPQRALTRLLDSEIKLCDCVIFGTSELGEVAVRGFNEFGSQEATKDLPAILFVDPRHSDLAAEAQLADHRVRLSMPLKLRELRETLQRLLRPQVGQVS